MNHLPAIVEELEKAKKEIKMWREFYIDTIHISIDRDENRVLDEEIRNAPIGIENITQFVGKQLKCYRESKNG